MITNLNGAADVITTEEDTTLNFGCAARLAEFDSQNGCPFEIISLSHADKINLS